MSVRAAILLLLAPLAACTQGGPAPACVNDEDCESGRRCHPSAKICVTDCRSSADCPDGEACGQDALCACEPSADRCPGALECHPLDRICVSVDVDPVTTVRRCGEDCNASRTCCDGFCLPDACTPRTCGSDQECVLEDATTRCDVRRSPPICVPRGACEVDDDCDVTEVCDPLLDPPACAAFRACTSSTDCDAGEMCDATKDPPRCVAGS